MLVTPHLTASSAAQSIKLIHHLISSTHPLETPALRFISLWENTSPEGPLANPGGVQLTC